MGIGKRQGNNPKRRIAPSGRLTFEGKGQLGRVVRYIGSVNHKLHPAAYGFPRPEPRPNKSVCDMERDILLPEAEQLVASGIR